VGKTYKRNDRWKKDRRDQNFKKSKKFKDFNHGGFISPKPNLSEPPVEMELTELNDS